VLLNPNQTHKSILLVDDERDIVNLFTEAFKNRNYDVVGFTNPLKALEHYKKNYDQYGIVISDIRMPEMDGFDLVKNLKKIDTNISIILMSAYVNIDYSQLNDDKCIYTKTNPDKRVIIYSRKALDQYQYN
jgi:DNA-binding NtrC family response regulator